MLNKDYAGATARIGANTIQRAAIPQNQLNWGLMLAQGINAYNDKKAYDAEQEKLGAYSAALKEAHPEDAARIDAMGALEAGAYYDNLAKEQQKRQWALEDMARKEQFERSMAMLRHKNALATAQYKASQDGNPFGSKNEFINLLGIKNNPEVWDKLSDEDKAFALARLSYLSNNPENIYEKSYQGQRGKETAKQEATDRQNAFESQKQQQTLGNAIDLVNSLDDNLFMPYTGLSSMVGTVSNGDYGLTPEENENYGYLERTIGSIENDLIAKARSKGQTGINTIAEIRQAAKGLQLGRGKQRLLGALQAMRDIEDKLDAMPTVMSVMPQNGGSVNKNDDPLGIF